jgi:hypothetical protein
MIEICLSPLIFPVTPVLGERTGVDQDCCIKYVKEVLRGFNHCSMKLGERMKFWTLDLRNLRRRGDVGDQARLCL